MADSTPESLIKEFLEDAERVYQRNALEFHFGFKADQTESARKILALPRPQQVPVLLYAIDFQVAAIQDRTPRSGIDLSFQVAAIQSLSTTLLKLTGLIAAILRKELPLSEKDLCRLVSSITRINETGWWSVVSPAGIMKAVEKYTKAHGLPRALHTALQRLTEKLDTQKEYSENRKLSQRVQNLLKSFAAAEAAENDSAGIMLFCRPIYELGSDETWTKSLSNALANLQPTERDQWQTLLRHWRWRKRRSLQASG